METPKKVNIPRPPGIFSTIKAGFDAVSTHLYILLLPVAIDAFLWLGPHAQSRRVVHNFLVQMQDMAQQATMPQDMVNQSFQVWQDILPHINFFAAIRTFPIGVPGLMWLRLPTATPLANNAPILDLTNLLDVVGVIAAIILTGWILGAIYLYIAAQLGRTTPLENEKQPSLSFAIVQSLLLMILWSGLAVLFGGGILVVSSLLVMLNPALGQTLLFMSLLALPWFILPIFFSPHGIFVYGYNAIESLLAAWKFSRNGKPFNSFFLFTIFALSYASSMIWNVPQENSWLLAVSIGGHAFVTTALSISSFIYYRSMTAWQKLWLTQLASA